MQPGLSRSIESYCYVIHSNCKYPYFTVDTLTSNCSVALSSLDSKEFLHVLLGKRLAVLEDEFPVQKDYFTFVKVCAKFVNCAVRLYYNTYLSNV